jgi:hypothetical protein
MYHIHASLHVLVWSNFPLLFTAAKENLTNQISEIRGYAWFWQPNCAAFKELVSHTHGTINGTKVKFARLLWASTDV